MKNYHSANRHVLFFVVLVGLFFTLTTSCDKYSNELKPYSDEIEFTKTIDYNGSTVLTMTVTQKIVIGEDSLLLHIKNPLNESISDLKVIFYVQFEDQYDKTMDYINFIEISQLAPLQDTTIVLLNHPELPLDEVEVYIRLLSSSVTNNNPISGYYQGQASYYFINDTVPSKFSFLKGFIEADGTCQFWMKLDEDYKKMNGQFIDTIDLNAMYTTNANDFTAILDTFSTANQSFLLEPTKIHFRTNLMPQPGTIEQRVQFTLFK